MGVDGWEGGLYEKGPGGCSLSFFIGIWTQIGDFSETGGLRSNIFWLWEHFYLEFIDFKGDLGLLRSQICLEKIFFCKKSLSFFIFQPNRIEKKVCSRTLPGQIYFYEFVIFVKNFEKLRKKSVLSLLRCQKVTKGRFC